MKFMRLAACAVAFAVVGGMVYAEDMDIKALQAKLAAQEARLNDLQAKMGSGSAATPANITSLRKNAKVTIGGDLDFRYVYDSYDTERFDAAGDRYPAGGVAVTTPGGWDDGRMTLNRGDAFVDTADLRVQVDVNEHMDAFLRIGSHDNAKNTGVVRDAWVRWKNICNSGWGILIGRDGLKFGIGKPYGMFDAWIQGGNRAGGMPTRLDYSVSRTTQINPYWESQDGKFRFDISLFQTIETKNAAAGGVLATRNGDTDTINHGLGSGTLKLQWKPTEDLTLVAAVANFYANGKDTWAGYRAYGRNNGDLFGAPGAGFNWDEDIYSNNNTALHFGFTYNPAIFCKKLNVWGQMTQEYNTGFVDGQDFFGVHAGLSYAFTDKLTLFAMGDYVRGDRSVADAVTGLLDVNGKITGWRSYLGAVYTLGNGAALEAGWTHESMRNTGHVTNAAADNKVTIKGDTLYTRLTFAF